MRDISHPATRRCGDAVTTSLCTSQRRRRYVSNETPNDVSVERRQDASVVRLYDFLLVCRDDVSRVCNNDVPSVSLQDVSNKPQMKHPKTSEWYVTKTSQWYASTTSLRRLPNETPNNVAVVRLLHVSELRCRNALSLIRSLLRFQITLSWPPSGRFSRLI